MMPYFIILFLKVKPFPRICFLFLLWGLQFGIWSLGFPETE